LTARRRRWARLRQPRADMPRPPVEILWRFRRWRVPFAVIRFRDGDVTAVEVALLAPP
jgi:hypothetical protein